jgi:vitamin B12 transporter
LSFAGDRLRLSLSGRWQQFHLRQPVFSGGAPLYEGGPIAAPPSAYTGDVALAYFLPGSGTKLRFHTGNSYRAPSLYERFGASYFEGFFSAYGDPRLAPERSVAVDAGIDQYMAGSKARVSMTFFYTRLREVIVFDFSGAIDPASDPFGRFGGYRNTGGGLARGIEVSGEAQLTRRSRVDASYTYTNSRERVSNLVGGSLRSIRIPRHMFTASATHTLWRTLDVTFDLYATSNYTFPLYSGGSRPFLFGGPRKADVVASYRHSLSDTRNVEFYTRVENVLNQAYFESGFLTPGAWAVAGMKFGF